MKKQHSNTLYVPKMNSPYDKLKETSPIVANMLNDWKESNPIRFWKLTDEGKSDLRKYTQSELDMLIKYLGLEAESKVA